MYLDRTTNYLLSSTTGLGQRASGKYYPMYSTGTRARFSTVSQNQATIIASSDAAASYAYSRHLYGLILESDRGPGLEASYCNVLVENCIFKGPNSAIRITNCREVIIRNCTIYGSTDYTRTGVEILKADAAAQTTITFQNVTWMNGKYYRPVWLNGTVANMYVTINYNYNVSYPIPPRLLSGVVVYPYLTANIDLNYNPGANAIGFFMNLLTLSCDETTITATADFSMNVDGAPGVPESIGDAANMTLKLLVNGETELVLTLQTFTAARSATFTAAKPDSEMIFASMPTNFITFSNGASLVAAGPPIPISTESRFTYIDIGTCLSYNFSPLTARTIAVTSTPTEYIATVQMSASIRDAATTLQNNVGNATMTLIADGSPIVFTLRSYEADGDTFEFVASRTRATFSTIAAPAAPAPMFDFDNGAWLQDVFGVHLSVTDVDSATINYSAAVAQGDPYVMPAFEHVPLKLDGPTGATFLLYQHDGVHVSASLARRTIAGRDVDMAFFDTLFVQTPKGRYRWRIESERPRDAHDHDDAALRGGAVATYAAIKPRRAYRLAIADDLSLVVGLYPHVRELRSTVALVRNGANLPPAASGAFVRAGDWALRAPFTVNTAPQTVDSVKERFWITGDAAQEERTFVRITAA